MSESVPSSDTIHPFLRGNFAPVTEEFVDYECQVTGEIPRELVGGQYIRNGGNPVYPPEQGRHYHWFDGDGMLHGVHFPDTSTHNHAGPSSSSSSSSPFGTSTRRAIYTNRHLATPLLDLTLLLLRSPIPSIALLISPLSSLHRIISAIIQAFTIAIRARLGVLSVANTSVIWWATGLGTEAEEEKGIDDSLGPSEDLVDGRLLATCESGPPLEVRVPGLETVRWDRLDDVSGESLGNRRGKWEWFKRWGLSRVQEDWMTAHPRVDPVDGSFIFYSTQMFDAPHARYSVIDRYGNHQIWKHGVDTGRAKMMHDFGCTRTHTIFLNLPLTLSPRNMVSFKPQPLIHFDRTLPSEFIIFPRLHPDRIIRFIDPEPCLIFHTANSWDDYNTKGEVIAINMLGCRFKSAKLVYSAGAVDVPKIERQFGKDDIVLLYYYRFDLTTGAISHAFPLAGIPFEFPTVPPAMGMMPSKYVYGCTMASGSFDERLGGAAKVDCLVKLDVLELIARGKKRGGGKWDEPVDNRSAGEIIVDGKRGEGVISIFNCPDGWYAQEPRFVPRQNGVGEDEGYLLSYVYDERYLMPDGTPSTAKDAGSELWVIDAKTMRIGQGAISCRIKLPQRVPYGLHGTWLPPSAFSTQRPLPTPLGPQELLQDKLARSRISHFVSIIFARPPTRDKSLFERVVLAFMWPAAFCILGVAITESYRHLSSSSNPPPAPEVYKYTVRSGVEGYEDLVGTMEKVGYGWGFTILVEVLAVGFVTLGWYLWPREGGDLQEVEKEE